MSSVEYFPASLFSQLMLSKGEILTNSSFFGSQTKKVILNVASGYKVNWDRIWFFLANPKISDQLVLCADYFN